MKTVQFKLKDEHQTARIKISYTNSCRRDLTIFKTLWQELSFDEFDTILKSDMELLDIRNYIVKPAMVVKQTKDDISFLTDYTRTQLVEWCTKNRPELKIKKSLTLIDIQKMLGI